MRVGSVGSWCLQFSMVVAVGCSLDTRPKLLPELDPVLPVEGTSPSNGAAAGSGADMKAVGASGSDAPADKDDDDDSDPNTGTAGAAGMEPSDDPPPTSTTGGAGGLNDPGVPSDPGASGGAGASAEAGAGAGAAGSAGAPPNINEPPKDGSDGRSLIDTLTDLLGRNPQVREAAAIRRIMDAIDTPAGTPPDVADAVDALGDVDCRRNSRTCVAVCGWAVTNCSYCMPDAMCMSDMQENCGLSCR